MFFLALVLISVLVIFTAVNRLIASKINVFVYKIMYAYIYIYVYINTHTKCYICILHIVIDYLNYIYNI